MLENLQTPPLGTDPSPDSICKLQLKPKLQALGLVQWLSGFFICVHVFTHLHVCGVGYFWVSESLQVASSVPGLFSYSISHIHDVQLFLKYYQGCDE